MSLNKAHVASDAKAHRLYAASKPPGLVPPITYTNATTEGLYKRPAMASPRADADNHLLHSSRGLTKQIDRV